MIGPLKNPDDKDRLLALIEQGSDADGRVFGRKKLIKLAFFAKYLDLDEDRLTTSSKFGDFNFIIYDYGPFSFDVMNEFDKLKEEDLVQEKKGPLGYTIRLTERGKTRANKIENKLEEENERLDKIADDFAELNGGQLEDMSLEYLGIDKDDKPRLSGTPVEAVITGESA